MMNEGFVWFCFSGLWLLNISVLADKYKWDWLTGLPIMLIGPLVVYTLGKALA